MPAVSVFTRGESGLVLEKPGKIEDRVKPQFVGHSGNGKTGEQGDQAANFSHQPLLNIGKDYTKSVCHRQ
jgi:hypothetical protein